MMGGVLALTEGSVTIAGIVHAGRAREGQA
jgi:hypothetical protein